MEAAFAIIISLQLLLLGWFIVHSFQCSAFHERVAKLEAEQRRTQMDIGDPDSGLRGQVHQLHNMFSGPYVKLQMELERREREGK